MELGSGEAVLLRGPNGCGKTTLLRTIIGLQPPTAGSITVDPDSIAYCGHMNGIKPTLTVAENLEIWASLHAGGGIGQALAAFDIAGVRDRPARNLSAGQCRRLCLSRLLVTGRSIWALDEPTVSLDATGVELFTQSLRKHLSSGGAAIVATHVDLEIAAHGLDVVSFRARAHRKSVFHEVFQ